MADALVFLDESGDLGWRFDQPYRHGGSSRYLTIAAMCCHAEQQKIPARAIRDLYRRRGWDPKSEKKWTHMNDMERAAFTDTLLAMNRAHPSITFHIVVVRKERVMEHIRRDPNKLYNYALRCCLLKHIAGFHHVTLIPDPRSIKVASGNALPDYLQMELWFRHKTSTTLDAKPRDSAASLQIQFVDMLAGLVQSRYEDLERSEFNRVESLLRITTLYFRK